MVFRLCVSTHVPPIVRVPRSDRGPAVVRWVHGRDFQFSAGGVTQELRWLIRAGQRGGWIADGAWWLCSGSSSLPRTIETDEGFRIRALKLSPRLGKGYASFCRNFWGSVFSIGSPRFSESDFSTYLAVGGQLSRSLRRLNDDVDCYFINNHQQVHVGRLLGRSKPVVLGWHIPFQIGHLPSRLRDLILTSLDAYDAVIVHSRRDRALLRKAGFSGRIELIYPHIDPSDYLCATQEGVAAFRERWSLGDNPVLLCVARMSPEKGAETLLQAFSMVLRRNPETVLVWAGDATQSTKRNSGQGLNSAYANRVMRMSVRLGVASSIRFTGHLRLEQLSPAYGASTAVILPSPLEGFGLVGLEAWLHHRSIIVSEGAGISEIVSPGESGWIFKPGSPISLASVLNRVLSSPGEALEMGMTGGERIRKHYASSATQQHRRLLEDIIRDVGKKSTERR